MKEFQRQPIPEIDVTANWSLKTLRAALHKAPDNLPEVSEDTLSDGFAGTWLWLATVADPVRNRHGGSKKETWQSYCDRSGYRGEINLIELAYQIAEKICLALWIKMKLALTRQFLTQARVQSQKAIQPCNCTNMYGIGSPRF